MFIRKLVSQHITMGSKILFILCSSFQYHVTAYSNVTQKQSSPQNFINYQIPLVTCQGFLGLVFYYQCTSWDSHKMGQPYGHYLDTTSLKLFIDLQNEIASWKSSRLLLGPDMDWTKQFQTSVFRKDIRSKSATVLSCFGTWCSCYVNIVSTVHVELCGRPSCTKHLNGTALVLNTIGNCCFR